MREHMGLFRGKRIDNGEWVEGYLFGVWEKAYILWGTTNGVPNMLEVDPDTVGECTSLRDKNGKLIFEGDVVRAVGKSKVTIGDVNYIPWHGAWMITPEKAPAINLMHHGRTECRTYEIIGTIRDNPELLKGGEGDG